MSDTDRKNGKENGSERMTAERIYALLLRLGDEVKELSRQVRALRKRIEGDENT